MRKGLAPALAVLTVGLAALGAAALRARAPEGAEALPPAERAEVEATARLFTRLAAHLKGSGGDPRFAERIPAAPAVVEELLAEAAFVDRAGRREEPRLQRIELGTPVRVAPGRVRIDARELWVTRVVARGGQPLETRSDVISVRYLLDADRGRWQVAAWSLIGPGGEGR
ncbi:MAG TPA: hypothetical protein VFP50_14910 [Anaeromyxobacteraceae bacterium]|nr:hypothetical protein [Anaeromyxobacteraceae bacterium]